MQNRDDRESNKISLYIKLDNSKACSLGLKNHASLVLLAQVSEERGSMGKEGTW